MKPERKAALDNIGFIWQVRDSFSESLKQLTAHLAATDGVYPKIGSKDVDEKQLANWVGTQRRRLPTMYPERKDALDSIGFVWKPKKGPSSTKENSAARAIEADKAIDGSAHASGDAAQAGVSAALQTKEGNSPVAEGKPNMFVQPLEDMSMAAVMGRLVVTKGDAARDRPTA